MTDGARQTLDFMVALTNASDGVAAQLPAWLPLSKLGDLKLALERMIGDPINECDQVVAPEVLLDTLLGHWESIKQAAQDVDGELTVGEVKQFPGKLLNVLGAGVCFLRTATSTANAAIDDGVAKIDEFVAMLNIGVWANPPTITCKDYHCLEVHKRASTVYRAFFFPVGHIQFWDLTAPPLVDPCASISSGSLQTSLQSRGEMSFRFTVPGLYSKYAMQASTFLENEWTLCGGIVPRSYVLAYRPMEDRVPANCSLPPPAFEDDGSCDAEPQNWTNFDLNCPGRTTMLAVVDGYGNLTGQHDLYDENLFKYGGSITGIAVSEEHDTVWACGQKWADASWEVLRFSLADVRGTNNNWIQMTGRQPIEWLKDAGAVRCTLTRFATATLDPDLLWVGAVVDPDNIDGGEARAYSVRVPPLPAGELTIPTSLLGAAVPTLTYGADVQGFAFFKNAFDTPHVALARCGAWFNSTDPCAIEFHYLDSGSFRTRPALPRPAHSQDVTRPTDLRTRAHAVECRVCARAVAAHARAAVRFHRHVKPYPHAGECRRGVRLGCGWQLHPRHGD